MINPNEQEFQAVLADALSTTSDQWVRSVLEGFSTALQQAANGAMLRTTLVSLLSSLPPKQSVLTFDQWWTFVRVGLAAWNRLPTTNDVEPVPDLLLAADMQANPNLIEATTEHIERLETVVANSDTGRVSELYFELAEQADLSAATLYCVNKVASSVRNAENLRGKPNLTFAFLWYVPLLKRYAADLERIEQEWNAAPEFIVIRSGNRVIVSAIEHFRIWLRAYHRQALFLLERNPSKYEAITASLNTLVDQCVNIDAAINDGNAVLALKFVEVFASSLQTVTNGLASRNWLDAQFSSPLEAIIKSPVQDPTNLMSLPALTLEHQGERSQRFDNARKLLSIDLMQPDQRQQMIDLVEQISNQGQPYSANVWKSYQDALMVVRKLETPSQGDPAELEAITSVWPDCRLRESSLRFAASVHEDRRRRKLIHTLEQAWYACSDFAHAQQVLEETEQREKASWTELDKALKPFKVVDEARANLTAGNIGAAREVVNSLMKDHPSTFVTRLYQSVQTIEEAVHRLEGVRIKVVKGTSLNDSIIKIKRDIDDDLSLIKDQYSHQLGVAAEIATGWSTQFQQYVETLSERPGRKKILTLRRLLSEAGRNKTPLKSLYAFSLSNTSLPWYMNELYLLVIILVTLIIVLGVGLVAIVVTNSIARSTSLPVSPSIVPVMAETAEVSDEPTQEPAILTTDANVSPPVSPIASVESVVSPTTPSLMTPVEPTASMPVCAYTIQPGDTINSIANRSRLNQEAILQVNPDLQNPNVITTGETLYLPLADCDF